MDIKILSTGVANVASVTAAFQRLGCQTSLITDEDTVKDAEYLVLPGVGSFAAGMASLREKNLIDILRQRIDAQRPTLAICLGLQLLADSSEESPGVRGLGCVPTPVEAFPDTVRRPQFGWNWLSNEDAPVLGEGGYVYYANSYRLTQCPPGWTSGWTQYGGAFIGCIQRGPVVACQFHPELSGAYGAQVLSRWLNQGRTDPC